jgi:HAD superfamily hydrolase (TIGR01509 family)
MTLTATHKARLIIFDLDGTLIDSERDIVISLKYCLGRFNLKPKSYDELKAYIGKGVRELIKDATGHEKGSLFEAVLSCFKYYYARHLLDHTKLYPGAKGVLESFHANQKMMAIASNKPGNLVKRIVKHFRLQNYFMQVIDGDNQDYRKPSPAGINKIIKHCGVTPEETLLVGDMAIDVLSAKNAGIKSCAFTGGIGKASDIVEAKPDFIIDKIEKLKEIVE